MNARLARRRHGRATLGVAAALLSAIVLPACGSSSAPKILDTERIEVAIQQSVLDKRHLHTQVTCPSGTLQKAKVTFICVATYKGGSTRFLVTEDSSGGAVHYVGLRG